MRHTFLGLLASTALACAGSAQAATTVIHAGHLLAEPGKPAAEKQSIVIENGKVTAIKDGFVAGDKVIDLSHSWVLPGLIDMHTHVTITMDIDSPAATSDFLPAFLGRPDARVLATIPRAQKILGMGFTTVRNLGDPASVTYSLRNAIDAGVVAGPRIFGSEPQFQVPGGDYEPFNFGVRNELEPYIKNRGTCSGVDDCARAVREEVRRGAGVIKLRITGQTMLDAKSGPMETPAELGAIIATAHRLNRKVATHTPGDYAANQMAIEAGTDTLEHGPLNDENIAAMKKKGTAFTATIMAAKLAENSPLGAGSDGMKGYYDRVLVSVKKASAAGVPILFGSDLPVVAAERTPEEFVEMQKAGMTPVDALKSATVNAAAALGKSDSLGSIAPGKWADVIAVDKDPLADLGEMKKVSFVMKGGDVFKDKNGIYR